MAERTGRRRIDWNQIVPGQRTPTQPAPDASAPSGLAALTAELMTAASPATLDRTLRHAVEFARSVIELERAAIYLLDEKHGAMVGTFGTDAHGQTIDERSLTYEFGAIDRATFERADAGFPWTVYEDCPQIAESNGETRVLGRGWVACTAIMGLRGPLGILFNDTALSHAPLDEAKQSRAAILCSLLGRALEPCRGLLVPMTSSTLQNERSAGIVPAVTELLVQDPTLSCDALAQRLKVSTRQLNRAFKRDSSTSLVEYRNQLRLARFLERIDADAHNLLDAALDAGFGSYAQFHRVFRARFGRGPREYLSDQRPTRASHETPRALKATSV
ncbi:MAG TPA: AraC family transcriptional regulator [Polyangiaceae bacterium]